MKRLIPLLLLAACSQPAPAEPTPAQPAPASQAITPAPQPAPVAPTPATATDAHGDPAQIARAYLVQKYPGATIDLGAPGAQEGAAGSIYMDFPATIGGRPATVIMRRGNDVDGSTAEQRRWHVERVDQP